MFIISQHLLLNINFMKKEILSSSIQEVLWTSESLWESFINYPLSESIKDKIVNLIPEKYSFSTDKALIRVLSLSDNDDSDNPNNSEDLAIAQNQWETIFGVPIEEASRVSKNSFREFLEMKGFNPENRI